MLSSPLDRVACSGSETDLGRGGGVELRCDDLSRFLSLGGERDSKCGGRFLVENGKPDIHV